MKNFAFWRDLCALSLIVAVGLWGAIHEMQVVVLSMVFFCLMVLYKPLANRFIRAALRFATNLSSAKFQDFEMTASARSSVLDGLSAKSRVALLEDLDADAFGLLFTLRNAKRLPLTRANHNRASFLRDRGLVQHDGAHLRGSTRIELTPLATELLDELLARETPLATSPSAANSEKQGTQASP